MQLRQPSNVWSMDLWSTNSQTEQRDGLKTTVAIHRLESLDVLVAIAIAIAIARAVSVSYCAQLRHRQTNCVERPIVGDRSKFLGKSFGLLIHFYQTKIDLSKLDKLRDH